LSDVDQVEFLIDHGCVDLGEEVEAQSQRSQRGESDGDVLNEFYFQWFSITWTLKLPQVWWLIKLAIRVCFCGQQEQAITVELKRDWL
jgi:hypothetical protein